MLQLSRAKPGNPASSRYADDSQFLRPLSSDPRLNRNLTLAEFLCKTDIVYEFKQISVHPTLWHLYGVKWKGDYFFYTRLVFGSRSSPKIFDWISQAVCWIANHNYGIEFIIHLLDDFLTIDRPSAAADRTMALITMIFNRLRIPISPSKTVGPTVQVQYLGIILDTDSMQARLPLYKVIRIREMLFKFGQKQSVSK